MVEEIDRCLGHAEKDGTFHYHMPSPCIADPLVAKSVFNPRVKGDEIIDDYINGF